MDGNVIPLWKVEDILGQITDYRENMKNDSRSARQVQYSMFMRQP